MTLTEQTSALRSFGYSQSEATFVAMAALHAGHFLARQYRNHRGKGAARLCEKAVAFEHAKTSVYGYRTTIYHLFAKPLYQALGEEDNRHRRDTEPARLRGKIMGFDYVLLNPDQRYLPTESAKLDYFVGERNINLDILPRKVYTGEHSGSTTRYFVEKFPIRINPTTNRVAFCYVDTGIFAEIGFLKFLQQYQALITASAPSEVVYISNYNLRFQEAARAFSRTFQLADTGLSPAHAAYFSERWDMETNGFQGRNQAQLDAYKALRKAHTSAQTEAAYVAWIKQMDSSSRSAEITFSAYRLPFTYSFFGNPQRGK